MPTQQELFQAAKENARLASQLQEKHPPVVEGLQPVQQSVQKPKTTGG